MSIKNFIKELGNNHVEGELIKTIFVSLTSSFVILAILYFLRLRNVSDFVPKYGFFLFFAILSYSLILLSVRHIRAYKEFACMSGMMIGMTIGMISGFLPGFFIGATNGMFWGSVVGMSIGILFGLWNGKCCGVMGAMEGIMAGFMGGLMGAMTALMMINDNLRAAGVIVFLISATILFGLNYMIYREARDSGMERKNKDSEFFTISWSFFLTIITTWFMVFGPRSVLFQ
ncbi:MAG: hypothetical protein Q8P15_00190 [Nanoarchaeota archaeon]|nr:hypothetical protein [Nanoarchaeota archaeon]